MMEHDRGSRSARKLGQGPVPHVRVIIVDYNSGPWLARCIKALSEQTWRDFEVVVVDNASTEGSKRLAAPQPCVRTIAPGQNVGFAAGSNIGAVDARAPLMALLNPDAIPDPDWLGRLIDAAEAHPDVQMFGSLQVRDDDPTIVDGAGDVFHCSGTAWRHRAFRPRVGLMEAYETFGVCAAAALVRTDWFRRAGGFDERYFCYFEDVDLAFRIRLLGGRVLQVNQAVVRHGVSTSTGTESDFVLYHVTRNQIWTFWKCMPLALLVPALPAHAGLLLAKWLKAVWHGRSAVFQRGVRDAYAGLPAIFATRRSVQAARAVPLLQLARTIRWSPLALFERGRGKARAEAASHPIAPA